VLQPVFDIGLQSFWLNTITPEKGGKQKWAVTQVTSSFGGEMTMEVPICLCLKRKKGYMPICNASISSLKWYNMMVCEKMKFLKQFKKTARQQLATSIRIALFFSHWQY
jgi:hypothetical protein